MHNSNSNKWSALLMFIAASILLVGCATGTVMKWTGQPEFVGQGGAMKMIDGADFDSGNMLYSILGLDYSHCAALDFTSLRQAKVTYPTRWSQLSAKTA
jgi:hypothetical protein